MPGSRCGPLVGKDWLRVGTGRKRRKKGSREGCKGEEERGNTWLDAEEEREREEEKGWERHVEERKEGAAR